MVSFFANISMIHVTIGSIVYSRPNFHNSKYIWPVGFKSTRKYTSILNPSHKIKYINEILAEDGGPVFKVTPEDDPEHPIVANSASGAWAYIVNKLNNGKSDKTMTVSGPGRILNSNCN